MNQEQEKFQKSLREFLTSARESGQQITAEQAEAFFEEQNLNEEQRAMVREYLEMEQIDIVGAEKKERKKREELPLSPEEEHFLKLYLEELTVPEELAEEEKEALFHAAAAGDALAKSRLLEYYMPKLPEIARGVYDQSVFFGDLVQEGSVSLLLALEHISETEAEQSLLDEIRTGMEALLEEHHYQKHQDEAVVHKVIRL